MKPLEVPSTADTEDIEDMECELHSKEFFVQVGMLVIEGRTPEHSEKGRIEGKHCVGLKGHVNHVCDERDKKCNEAFSWVQQIEQYWHQANSVVIDVFVQLTDKADSLILLEQWTISIVNSNGPSTSGSLLLQSVRSHIHFSQLSAWLSLTKGSLPYNIQYSITHPSGTGIFIQEPVEHIFPLASLPGHRSLQVMVRSLPRYSLHELIETLEREAEKPDCTVRRTQDNDPYGKLNDSTKLDADTRSPLRKRTCLKKVTKVNSSAELKDMYALCSSRSSKSTDLESEFLKLDTGESNSVSPKKNNKEILGSDFLNFGASCSTSESNGIGNLNERIDRLGRDIEKIERNISKKDCTFSGLSKLLKESSCSFSKEDTKRTINKSSKDGIVDKKTHALCTKERTNWDSGDMTKTLLQRKCRSLSEQVEREGLCSNGAASKQANTNSENPFSTKLKSTPTRQGTASNSSDVDIHAIRQNVDRACFRRSVQLPIGACTEPVFHAKTGLPISSSPAPLRRSTNELYEDTTDFTDGLSNKVDYRELSKLLSRSAPASTTQSLLVNFEESVLNGRMEPVGTVEGFTAELSASGSFCPRHVKLPIISCFYRLSDDDAPSPYMGYISLKGEQLGRRGYHVPKCGTIQLTVFNPNVTVVKMFVVMYDCSDMPPRSQTFLRQKTYSALKGNVVKNEAQQTLHYLLHLRFASSKSGKIYLHTDIRVIFARQPPDLGHIYQLYTVTDGPTDPKYTKRHHISVEPEC